MAKEKFLYLQLYEQIKQSIVDGKYPLGALLPTEDELKNAFDVSLITVKKSLSMLVEDGFIKRVPGKGTFVLSSASIPISEAHRTQTKNRLIGVIFEHVSTPFGLDMMYEIDRIAQLNGYKLCIRFSYGSMENETSEIDFLLSQRVEGLIVMPSHGKHYNPAILKLFLNNFPIILVDKKLNGIPVPSVRTDNHQAIAALVSSLAQAGRNNIAFICKNSADATSLEERKAGFYAQMDICGKEIAGECVLSSEWDMRNNAPYEDDVATIVSFLQANTDKVEAIVCAEYGIIPSLVQAAKQLDISLTEDIMVCTIDEDYLAPNKYSFMHMKQDEKKIAQTACKLLLEKIQGKQILKDDYFIPAIFMPQPANSMMKLTYSS